MILNEKILFKIAVILFMRMWVEIHFVRALAIFPTRHPLHEDVSWNSQYLNIGYSLFLSSSSWGCELKCICCHCLSRSVRHPLHEDVSWNRSDSSRQVHDLRHPLHEDVSWNDSKVQHGTVLSGHPLHEDVSWNYWCLGTA